MSLKVKVLRILGDPASKRFFPAHCFHAIARVLSCCVAAISRTANGCC
jgi:hypothetical protein